MQMRLFSFPLEMQSSEPARCEHFHACRHDFVSFMWSPISPRHGADDPLAGTPAPVAD